MPIELPKAFGQVLRTYRLRKGWSQMTLAMEAGMHLNALGNLERGQRNPSLQTVFLLCDGLGVSVAEFMAAVEKAADQKNRYKTKTNGL